MSHSCVQKVIEHSISNSETEVLKKVDSETDVLKVDSEMDVSKMCDYGSNTCIEEDNETEEDR